ncbi:MAG TPA: LuxR C-terminal-related transcriptional regulator [Fimbriimonadaceae bacterium]|nr:LuxR C-terminal-related transcriptional regulator [Fimbriimonadaceae bacterium]
MSGYNLRLTDREMEVLDHLRQGSTMPEAAKQMLISQNTVKNHLRNIIEKLQLWAGPEEKAS